MKRYSKERTRIEDDYRVYKELTHTGNCSYCGDEFKSRSILAKYCSQRCKNDIAIDRKKDLILKKKQDLKKCIVCSGDITQNRTSKIIKYCSNKCKQAYYRKAKKTALKLNDQ